MNKNIYGYGNPYNPDVLKDLEKIKKEMEDELKKEEPDKERLFELKEKQLMRGMELSTGTMNGRTYRGYYPW
jgi:hypothetical protein